MSVYGKFSRIIIPAIILFVCLSLTSETPTAYATTFDCSSVTSISETQCEALVSIYNSMDGDNWTDNSGWLVDPDPCYWNGVYCSSYYVKKILLPANGLSGELPINIGDLDSITYLALQNNSLSGEIPDIFGSFSQLLYLYLSDNQFSGSIPDSIGLLDTLYYLDLDSNQLTGEIPPEIGNMSHLNYLDLRENNLSGRLPSELGALVLVDHMYLSDNNFSGSIPPEFASLTHLMILELHNNPLDGSLPVELTALNALNLFTINDTNICEPQDTAFQDWLTGIINYTPSGIDCTLGAVGLQSPSGNIITSDPVYVWNEDDLADEYWLYVEGPGGIVYDGWLAEIDVCSEGTCSYSTGAALSQGAYTWKVQTKNSTDYGPWSDELGFDYQLFVDCDSQNSIAAAECSALVDFYNNTNGDTWIQSGSWLQYNDPCLWEGVSCEFGRVYDLDASAFGLDGELPESLVNLTWLRTIIANNNPALSGRIPENYPDMRYHITTLNLSNTNVCEPLDPEMQSWLTALFYYTPSGIDCFMNKVTLLSPQIGTTEVDPEFAWTQDDPADEYRLYVEGSGGVEYDDWLAEGDVCAGGECGYTAGINLANGSYTWKVQTRLGAELGPWSTAAEFKVFDCSAQSSIPEAECNALVDLYVSTNGDDWNFGDSNWLDETDPCDWYRVYCEDGHVSILDLGYYDLVGTIPTSMGNLTELVYLYMYGNGLTGSLPAEMGLMSSLVEMKLGNNFLAGEIPSEFGSLSSLEVLDISNNQLSGSLPSELGNLSSLVSLMLERNDLSGSIPAELGNLSTVTEIFLNSNEFSGEIPAELGALSTLEYLGLKENNLSGSIPANLSALSSLNYLIVNNNNLSGRIPDEYTSLTIFSFQYDSTNICTPQDPTMQTWLSGITTVIDSGIDCPYIANLQAPSGKIFDTSPTFTWDEDSGAEEYRFYLNDVNGNLVNTWLAEGDICSEGTCSYSAGLDLALGNYNWTIQTRSTIEAGPWAEYMQFNISVPEPLSPTGRINDVRPEYTWEEWTGSDDYRLFVSHAAVGTVVNEWFEASAVCSEGTCAAISDVHLQTGNHSFTFQARNDAGTINDWSTYLDFKLLNDSPPDEAIIPISPTGGEQTTINPTYSWNEVDRASWYKVFIGSNETGKVYNAYHRAAEVCYGTLCQITPAEYLLSGSPVSSLEYGIAHQWFVMPVNVMGNGAWSDAQQFETEPEP